MIKVTFIGAGSTVFMKNILTDILLEKNFSNCEIVLQDIDDRRLKTSNLVAEKVAKSIGANPKIIIEKNQKKALRGADFVILMFQIGGYEPSTVIDFEIPAKYGLKQTIGDTLGIGGIMRGLRTVPALLSVAKDMNISTGVIDPLGATLDPGKDLYFDLISNMSKSFKGC